MPTLSCAKPAPLSHQVYDEDVGSGVLPPLMDLKSFCWKWVELGAYPRNIEKLKILVCLVEMKGSGCFLQLRIIENNPILKSFVWGGQGGRVLPPRPESLKTNIFIVSDGDGGGGCFHCDAG